MIETILLVILAFGGGWFSGHKNSTETILVDCKNRPLVTSECVDIVPPADDSFGATTASYVSIVGQYRKCRAACEQ